MKLVDIIEYLEHPEKLEKLYQDENVNVESEAILIYLKDDLNINSEIKLFQIEQTEDDILYKNAEGNYVQLFPVDYAIELISSDLDLVGKGNTNLKIAQRLLEYRIKDA